MNNRRHAFRVMYAFEEFRGSYSKYIRNNLRFVSMIEIGKVATTRWDLLVNQLQLNVKLWIVLRSYDAIARTIDVPIITKNILLRLSFLLPNTLTNN